MTVGILDITAEQYHSVFAASFSNLKLLKEKTPAHVKARFNQRYEPTAAQEFGTAFHLALLEPMLYQRYYGVMPEDMNRTTKEGKAKYAELTEAFQGVLKFDEAQRIKAMVASVRKHHGAASLLERVNKIETSIFWHDPETNAHCKARIDALASGLFILDVKTTEDASPEEFAKSIANYKYHWQTAHYKNGLKALGMGVEYHVTLAVEKAEPYCVAVYQIEEADVRRGAEDVAAAIKLWKECIERDAWPGYAPNIQDISLPSWAKKAA